MSSREYRGITFEKWIESGLDCGYIVNLYGEEIWCNTMKDVEKLIDEYIDEYLVKEAK